MQIKFLIGLTLLSLFLAGCGSAPKTVPPGELKPTFSSFPVYVPGEKYRGSILALLKSARNSIEIFQNELLEKSFVDQLIELKKTHGDDASFTIHLHVAKPGLGIQKKLKRAGIVLGPKLPLPNYLLIDGHKILSGSVGAGGILLDSTRFADAFSTYVKKVDADPKIILSQIVSDASFMMFVDKSYLNGMKRFLSLPSSGDQLTCSMQLFQSGVGVGADIVEQLAKLKSGGSKVRVGLGMSSQGAAASLKKEGLMDIAWIGPASRSDMNFCVLSYAKGGYSVILGSSNWTHADLELTHQLNWQIEDPDGIIAIPFLANMKKHSI